MPGFVTMVFYTPIKTIESGYTISLREDQPFGNVKCSLRVLKLAQALCNTAEHVICTTKGKCQ